MIWNETKSFASEQGEDLPKPSLVTGTLWCLGTLALETTYPQIAQGQAKLSQGPVGFPGPMKKRRDIGGSGGWELLKP